MHNRKKGGRLTKLIAATALLAAIACLLPIRVQVAGAAAEGLLIQAFSVWEYRNVTTCTRSDHLRVGRYAPGATIHFWLDIPNQASIDLGTVSAGEDGYVWLYIDQSTNPLPSGFLGTCRFRTDYIIDYYQCGSHPCNPHPCNSYCCGYDWLGNCNQWCYDTCYDYCPDYCPRYAYADLEVVNAPPYPGSNMVQTWQDTPISFTLNGADADGDELTFTVTKQPEHGTLTGSAPDLIYTPNSGWTGTDNMRFSVNDGQLNSPYDGSVIIAVAPANDLCTNALSIDALPATIECNVQPTTTSDDDPLLCASAGASVCEQSLWYKLTPDFTGMIRADTIGSNYDTILSVFTGTCGEFITVTCNDDRSPDVKDSQVSWLATAGTTYYIEVASHDGYAEMLKLNIFAEDSTPPVVTLLSITPPMVKGGDSVHIRVNATDNIGVTSTTANSIPLIRATGENWEGAIPADPAIGENHVEIRATDASGNVGTISGTYKTARVLGVTCLNAGHDLMRSLSSDRLVCLWGRVAVVDENNFTIDDGSGSVLVEMPAHGLLEHQFVITRGILNCSQTPHVLQWPVVMGSYQ